MRTTIGMLLVAATCLRTTAAETENTYPPTIDLESDYKLTPIAQSFAVDHADHPIVPARESKYSGGPS